LPEPSQPINNKNDEEEMELVRKYMEKHDIYRISVDNGKLLVEYNSKQKKALAVVGRELETIKNLVEKQANQSITHEHSLNNNQPEKSNYPL